MAKTAKREFGDDAEDFVCGWLEKNKFKIVARNYVCRHGEIDIIASEKNTKTLCFVEVKARTDESAGHPGEAIRRPKIKRIVQTARQYIYDNKLDAYGNYRFDVALLMRSETGALELEYLRAAFEIQEAGFEGFFTAR